jgi:hypothetical protein
MRCTLFLPTPGNIINTPYITAILAITSLSFSTGAMTESLSGSEYRAAERKISADYKSAKKSCNLFARNAREICMAEARRTERVAKAKLYAVAREMSGMSAACCQPTGNFSRAG